MSYHVDPVSQLFDDLSPMEAQHVFDTVRACVLGGTSLYADPAFEAWRSVLQYDERQGILIMATVYPQRALLSLITYGHAGMLRRGFG